jgi:transposase InsO family protein
MCRILKVARRGYYRWISRLGALAVPDANQLLVAEIEKIALDMSSYGYRSIAKELRRRGFQVNHKRVLRLMREGNLVFKRKKAFVVTTDSKHSDRVYPNLVPDLSLTGLDQLWVSDITYIRLKDRFVYLAVILDAFSRRCIGWALGTRITAGLTSAALRQALKVRIVKPGLVHHSDRGAQYADSGYIQLLKSKQIEISMSRSGNPYDNAKAERFMKTLKYEEVYLNEYQNLAQARSNIAQFIDQVYNRKRLHSAIGYVPPAEYEATFKLCTLN